MVVVAMSMFGSNSQLQFSGHCKHSFYEMVPYSAFEDTSRLSAYEFMNVSNYWPYAKKKMHHKILG